MELDFAIRDFFFSFLALFFTLLAGSANEAFELQIRNLVL